MVESPEKAAPPSRNLSVGIIGWWLLVLVSFGLLLFMIVGLVLRFSSPIPLHRLQVVQDIPLPGALPDPNRANNPLAPGLAARFDHFDFQALDPQTHLLFMVHTGPNPDREHAVDPKFDPNTDVKTDGNIIVFNTQQNKVVGLVQVPQAAGVAVAPDLGRAYIGDVHDGIIFVVDESTLTIIAQIQLDPNDGPDDIEYDQLDHRIFVADPGNPVNPDKTMIPARANQNLAIIDALTNKLVTKIFLGNDGSKYGDDVGHTWFDSISHREFVITLPLPNLDDPNAVVTPPSFLTVINPITNTIDTRVKLPDACVNPHGLTIDTEQRVAFIACVDSQNLVRFDLQTMQPFPDATLQPLVFNPDILRIDHTLHLLFAGCAAGFVIFDESGRGLKRLGDYFLGGGSHHTIAIDEQTQTIYLPLPSIGGRPVLRIIRYVANGV